MMSLDPIADDRREFSKLQIETTILPRSDAKRVFVEPYSEAVVAGIEAAIDTRLREDVNTRPELRIQEKREPRVEEKMFVRVDQSERRLVDSENFEINEP